jgi:hypothetical protein
MVEPVTIGTLVASALGMVAEAALKGAVGEAVKDGYSALKGKISRWAPSEVAALEGAPSSKGRQATVAEIVDSLPSEEVLRDLSVTLIARLKENTPDIGLDIGDLTALEVQLGNITVTSGTGARVWKANVASFKTGDISVGSNSEKK